ncbi:MAG: hypothetical protein IPI46_01250 [Bacteroidetes bacterium]|nr:hypothetical protein [Bacteroidota bacterium]
MPSGFTYDSWVTLKIRLLPNGSFLYSVDDIDHLDVSGIPDASVRIQNVILQGHNYDPIIGSD